MTSAEQVTFRGQSCIPGTASGTLLASDLELSFWGGVDPVTGEVVDRYHPLSKHMLKDTILAIPGGRGSCTGSATILELLLNGMGPSAILFKRVEPIIALGVIVATELFEKSIPILVLEDEDFQQILKLNGKTVHVCDDQVSSAPLLIDRNEQNVGNVPHLENMGIQLTEFDQAVLQGDHGEASKFALTVIIQVAHMMGARELMDVSNAHIDGAWYGPGSVAVGKKLRDWGGTFRVPTTVNALSIDHKRWRTLGIDTDYGLECEELADAFVQMGAKQSFTCAPYLGDNVPKLGEAVAWGESNAVIYANSILGARTLKYPNMLEYLIALTGRAPKAGVYLDENRLASVEIKVQVPEEIDDSFWPILGYAVGAITNGRIPAISGIQGLDPSTDDFKAFAAAFGTSSSASMFHMVGLTAEAPTIEAVISDVVLTETIDLSQKDLYSCWNKFNRGCAYPKVDLVSLGNPHFSFNEIKRLAQLCRGRTKSKDVLMIITCGRSQYGLASQACHVEELQKFGVQFLTDTCWCSIREPVIQQHVEVIMTNSGKYIHYGPGLTGRQFCFGSLEMCVDAACSGGSDGRPPNWLQEVTIS